MHTTPINEVIATNVAKAMRTTGDNASTIEAKTGIHRSTIARRLKGKSDWKTSELEKLAPVLAVQPHELMVEVAA